MAGRNGGNFPAKVLKPTEVQSLRTKLVEGADLTTTECLELIASHEHLRAYALSWHSRTGVLTQENEDLMLALRRVNRERNQP